VNAEPKDYIKGAKKPAKKSSGARWVIVIVGWTFVLSILLSLLSNATVPKLSFLPAVLVLLCFIALGVFFDILGLSVAIAPEKPFHAMAANRVKSAFFSIWLLRRADRVACFCNDVVGDITGIISGATASVIIAGTVAEGHSPSLLAQLLFSALVASITVGGKALGKTVALRHNVKIVTFAGKVLSYFRRFMKKPSKAGKDAR
jgi:hypothetical protein